MAEKKVINVIKGKITIYDIMEFQKHYTRLVIKDNTTDCSARSHPNLKLHMAIDRVAPSWCSEKPVDFQVSVGFYQYSGKVNYYRPNNSSAY
jgi:hypothetical protein